MLRTIFAVIVGYLVMIVFALLGIGIAWLLLGATGAFREGTTTASTTWSLFNCVFGFIGAMLGGLAAARIGKHDTNLPVKILAGFALVFGLFLAVMTETMSGEPTPLPEGKTVAELSFTEAGSVAKSPAWYNFTIPFIGAIGVLVGGRQRG